jgi:hypothetical protein
MGLTNWSRRRNGAIGINRAATVHRTNAEGHCLQSKWAVNRQKEAWSLCPHSPQKSSAIVTVQRGAGMGVRGCLYKQVMFVIELEYDSGVLYASSIFPSHFVRWSS